MPVKANQLSIHHQQLLIQRSRKQMPDSLSTRIFHQESQSYQADSAEEPQKPEKSFTLRQKEETPLLT